jgi:hypothetical protein
VAHNWIFIVLLDRTAQKETTAIQYGDQWKARAGAQMEGCILKIKEKLYLILN